VLCGEHGARKDVERAGQIDEHCRARGNDFAKIPNGGPDIENRLQLIYHYGGPRFSSPYTA
jgi:hypothetical protein